MNIPDRSEFSEVSKVAMHLGLKDPTEILPKLHNELESVPASADSIRTIASELRTAATDLTNEVGAARWTGDAADAFRKKADKGTQELQRAAGVLDDLAGQLDVTPEQVEKVLGKVLKYLVLAGLLAGAIIAMIAASGPIAISAAVVGFLTVLAMIDGALLTDFPAISEGIAAVINAILDLLCPDPYPKQA